MNSSNKELKDYLKFYICCNVIRVKYPSHGIHFLHSVDVNGNVYVHWKNSNPFFLNVEDDPIKPLLRPLSDMTEEELKEQEIILKVYEPDYEIDDKMRADALKRIKEKGVNAIQFADDNNPMMVFELFKFYLSKHFDLFGLIESGLAIDKTKLKP